VFWALQLISKGRLDGARPKLMLAPVAVLLLACAAAALPRIGGWPLPYNVGGLLGDVLLRAVTSVLAMIRPERASTAAGLFCFAGGVMLLMTSLGLSQRDLKLICQRSSGSNWRFVARAWRLLGEMSERTIIVRREPRLGMPAPLSSRAPAYVPPRPAPIPDHRAYPARREYRPEPDREPVAFEVTSDNERKQLKRILKICAPERAGKSAGTGEPDILLPAEPVEAPRPYVPADPIRAARDVLAAPRDDFPHTASVACRDPAPFHGGADPWPASEPAPRRPAPMPPPPNGWRPQSLPGGDDLYGRAVAIVLSDRKASSDYLQQRLQIGYMRAADLIERMEREGILGAPVYNNMRPILIGAPGSREI